MRSPLKPVPEGYHTVTPYITVHNAAQAIAFYERAFGAQERRRITGDDGSAPGSGPQNWPISLHLYVDDADAWIERALAAGAALVAPVKLNEDDGEKRGGVRDPFGFTWWLATRVQDISRAEMQRRHDAKTLR